MNNITEYRTPPALSQIVRTQPVCDTITRSGQSLTNSPLNSALQCWNYNLYGKTTLFSCISDTNTTARRNLTHTPSVAGSRIVASLQCHGNYDQRVWTFLHHYGSPRTRAAGCHWCIIISTHERQRVLLRIEVRWHGTQVEPDLGCAAVCDPYGCGVDYQCWITWAIQKSEHVTT